MCYSSHSVVACVPTSFIWHAGCPPHTSPLFCLVRSALSTGSATTAFASAIIRPQCHGERLAYESGALFVYNTVQPVLQLYSARASSLPTCRLQELCNGDCQLQADFLYAYVFQGTTDQLITCNLAVKRSVDAQRPSEGSPYSSIAVSCIHTSRSRT